MNRICSGGNPFICVGCGSPITDRFLLEALGKYWHEDCLKCSCCSCRLGEVGSTLYAKTGMLLCKRDYFRLFGKSGTCSACQKRIHAFEMIMRAGENCYHLDCFACCRCQQRFCVGDRFYLLYDKVFCEFDFNQSATTSFNQQSEPGSAEQQAQEHATLSEFLTLNPPEQEAKNQMVMEEPCLNFTPVSNIGAAAEILSTAVSE